MRVRGSDFLLIFLFLCGIVPGLLYAIFAYGREFSCEKCHTVLHLSVAAKQAYFRRQRLIAAGRTEMVQHAD